MTAFEEGYAFFEKQAGVQVAGGAAGAYVGRINDAIGTLLNDLNSFRGFNTASDKLKGDIAEFWQADTFNIHAAARSSASKAFVNRSHDFASADISSNFGKKFGLKYYKTGADSAKQQAKSLLERYKEYQGSDTYEQFLGKRGLETGTAPSDPIYAGQVRVIPADQMESACNWLKNKIAKESVTRPDQVKRYQETLSRLTDRLKDGKGTESVPLTEADAKVLADMAKDGAISADTLKELGVSTSSAIHFDYLMSEAAKAGLTAAAISVALQVAPEIYRAISYLVQTGEVDEQQLRKIGLAALQGGSEGFVRGSVSAAITIACQSGILGKSLTAVSPNVVAAAVVLTMDTMKNAFAVATGNMTRHEMVQELIHEMFISSSSLLFGTAMQGLFQVPAVGFLLGSFLGSVIGSFAYTCGYNAVISFCIDTGFTMFGLVNQDYTLPESVIKEMGMDVFDHIQFEPQTINVQRFTPIGFQPKTVQPCTLGLTVLRRGVIGVSQIGYV